LAIQILAKFCLNKSLILINDCTAQRLDFSGWLGY